VRALSVHGVPFPAPVARRIAMRVAGADSSGTVTWRIDRAVRDIVIRPTAAVLYRRKRPHAP
jgi:hypothetical protein